MPQFQHIYDGKNEGVTLPSGERLDKAQENLGRTILDAEKIRLEEFRKNEDWLLKSTTVDLKALASAGASATQTKYYEKFIDDTTKIVKQAGGFNNLTTDQKIEINKKKAFFDAEQNKLLGDQKKFEMAEHLAKTDPRYDYNKFQQQIGIPYATTGVFNDAPIPYKAKNLGAYFNDNKVKGTTYTEDKYETNIYGKKVYQPIVINGTQQEAEAHVENRILADPQLLEGAFEEFSALPESEQMKYLADFDTNKDGALSEQEKQTIPKLNAPTRDNPILKYAKEKYWQQVRTVTQSKETGAAPPSTNKGGISFLFGGKKIEASPAYKNRNPITYGNQTYYDTYAFPTKIPVSNVKTSGGISYESDDIDQLEAGSIQGFIKDYIADKDIIILEATKEYPDLSINTGANIGVPADNIPDVNNLPIKDENGVVTTVGKLRGNKAIPERRKLKYNPKTGKLE